jgi:citrate synthase
MQRPVIGHEIEIQEGVITSQDLSRLGVVCYDPGFYNTAACKSAITHIDPLAGQLEYRGYPIEELAESRRFVDVSHLLVHGVLPNDADRKSYAIALRQAENVPAHARAAIDALPKRTHPMVALQVGLASLGASVSARQASLAENAIVLVAQAPTLVAYIHARHEVTDAPGEDVVSRFLFRSSGREVDPTLVHALETVFTLHADHEQNCSTNVVRAVLSAGGDLFAAASAGAAALAGPLHGGANEAVMRTLEEIGTPDRIPAFIAGVRSKTKKLSGFGHPVYHAYDPRAAVLKKVVPVALAAAQQDDHLLQLAFALEAAALSDQYFVERNLYPNVDFYSGLIYRALGFGTDEFTAVFAAARVTGWAAHALEQSRDAESRIYRPRQLYQGPRRRGLSTRTS